MARLETLFLRYRERGDVRALGRVFDRTADETLRVAMYFARDPAQAEEWLQQTYLIVIERAESWDASRPFMPWLMGVLRNVVRRVHAERKLAPLPESPLPAPRARDVVEDAEWTAAVAEAVEALGDPYRAVLMLRLQHGLAPAEIARLQRVPCATIRSQIHRGLAQLRASLRRDHSPVTLAGLPVPVGLATIRTSVLTVARTHVLATAATAPAASALLLGGLVVNKIALAALAVAVLAIAVIDPLGFWANEPDAQRSSTREGPSESNAAKSPHLQGRDTPPDEPEQSPEMVAGPDVDLDRIDRERDLHGIVVLRNGQPVIGADVRVEETPWRSQMINDLKTPETFELASTTTGPRGTFVLRLREGIRGRLVVTAPGYASRQMWSVAAGERVRIVLDRAVSLLVRVKAPDGTPAPDVRILVSGAGAGVGPRAPARATTDGQGIARVNGLDPKGTLMVEALPQHEGWGCSDLTMVTLPATGVHEHEIQLPTGRTIRGVVTDAATGEPIPGARLGMGWGLDPSVRTDDGGAYVLHGWTGDGGREITVSAPGYVRGRKGVDPREDLLDFALTVGANLRGRVVDESNTPVERAQVAVVGSVHEGSVQRLSLANGWTDAEGRFALGGLAADMPLSINVRADGHARRIVDIDAVGGSEHDVGDIVLTAPLTLVGKVVRGDGTPAARVSVRIMGANADRAVRRASKKPPRTSYGTRADVTTDDLGRFTINDLCQGEFVLMCKARAPLVETTVTLDGSVARTDVTLHLPNTRTLRVQVLDPAGAPATDGIVSARHEGRRIYARVDSRGRADLEIPDSVTAVRFRAFDHSELMELGEIPVPEDSDELVIRQRRALLIRGVVVRPDGSPIGRAFVEGLVEGRRKHSVVTDDAGRFSMNCAHDFVDLAFRGTTYRDGKQVYVPFIGENRGVRCGARDVRIQTVALKGNEKLVVRVLGPAGPLHGLHIRIEPGQGFVAHKRTDAEGRVVFEGLAPIMRTVQVSGQSAGGARWGLKRVDAMPGDPELTITMERPVLVQVLVLGPDGNPAGGVMVNLRAPDDPNRILGGGITPESGTFRLAVPASTRLRFTASKMIGRALFQAELVIDETPTQRIELRLAPKKR